MSKKGQGIGADFFANFKLPTHLPNEVHTAAVEQLPVTVPAKPSSLPSKPPVVSSLPPIPRASPKKNPPAQQVQPTVVSDEDDGLNAIEEVYGKNEPMAIPGTTIILDTDEDIQKWIEERKRNWPSRRRMEEKLKQGNAGKRGFQEVDKDAESNADGGNNKRPRRYCKFFARGNCRNENCPNLHEQQVRPLPNNRIVHHHGIAINVPERYSRSMNSGKSLHNLVVEHDYYKYENGKILDIVEKLVTGGFVSVDYDKINKK